MDGYQFAEELIKTQDLDPVYTILHHAEFPDEKLHRWLVAYWCFYNVGTASVLSEIKDKDFWMVLNDATVGTVFPRGTERRHFRGENALKSVADLRSRASTATELIRSLIPQNKSIGALAMMSRVQDWNGFGPWIAFKVSDMIERLGLARVEFKPEHIFNMFDSPRKGAELFYKNHLGTAEEYKGESSWVHVYIELTGHLINYTAPPGFERPINIQEVETVLCKYKSALSGHYNVGKDIKEIKHALLRYASCKTSQALLKAGKSVLW